MQKKKIKKKGSDKSQLILPNYDIHMGDESRQVNFYNIIYSFPKFSVCGVCACV